MNTPRGVTVDGFGISVWVQDIIRPLLVISGMIESWEGTQAALHCLLSDDVADHSGAFFSQRGMYAREDCNKGGRATVSPNPEAVAKRLWNLSADGVGG